MRPEFGFDKALFTGLAEKLACFPRNECRGVLMFDEIQISKNVDFRSETGRLIGMIDYGEYTTTEDEFKEGDHALVFLFQPHLSARMGSKHRFFLCSWNNSNNNPCQTHSSGDYSIREFWSTSGLFSV